MSGLRLTYSTTSRGPGTAYETGKVRRDERTEREAMREFPGKLVTSNFIFDETVSLCLYRLGHHAAKTAGTVLMNPEIVDLLRITSEDEQAAWRLFLRRSNHDFSFTDCTSFAIMRRLGLPSALALDDDFRAEGFTVMP